MITASLKGSATFTCSSSITYMNISGTDTGTPMGELKLRAVSKRSGLKIAAAALTIVLNIESARLFARCWIPVSQCFSCASCCCSNRPCCTSLSVEAGKNDCTIEEEEEDEEEDGDGDGEEGT